MEPQTSKFKTELHNNPSTSTPRGRSPGLIEADTWVIKSEHIESKSKTEKLAEIDSEYIKWYNNHIDTYVIRKYVRICK